MLPRWFYFRIELTKALKFFWFTQCILHHNLHSGNPHLVGYMRPNSNSDTN